MSAADNEMFAPDIPTGMEQSNDCACVGIDTREVWPFVRVATITGEREVVRVISSTMLLGHNMLDVKRNQWRRFLQNAAVFAGVTGMPSDKLSRARIHFPVLCGLPFEKPPRLCLYDRDHIDGFNEILVFCILRSR
jgi:hypothetical protein